MNREDPFEARLKRQPLRPIPAAWREEVLAAAREASRIAPGLDRTAAVPVGPAAAAGQRPGKGVDAGELRGRCGWCFAHSRGPGAVLGCARAWLAAVLWPHPRAWAGLAAVWMLVLGLNFAAREPAGLEVARQAGPPSPQVRELLQQQEQLLAELVGPKEPPVATRRKPFLPGPHSELRRLCVCV